MGVDFVFLINFNVIERDTIQFTKLVQAIIAICFYNCKSVSQLTQTHITNFFYRKKQTPFQNTTNI